MSVTNLTITPLATSLFTDTANGAAAVAVKASGATVYALDVDNTANAALSYVKLYNLAAGSVTVGTTAPDAIFAITASVRQAIPFPAGWAPFTTALSVATLTAGGTAGTTAPSSSVIVRIAYA